jgi:hypothetical protein
VFSVTHFELLEQLSCLRWRSNRSEAGFLHMIQ